MKAWRLHKPALVEQKPLRLEEIPDPSMTPGDILLRVHACGLCHTDIHVIEADLSLSVLPLTPGHQIVGVVGKVEGLSEFKVGDRVGIPWLHATCGTCEYCRDGKENLCDNARFTGYHADGGYAEYAKINSGFAYHLPEGFPDMQAAPLLCAGVIGYRALRLSDVKPGGRIGLYGFGASAHLGIQILRHRECEVYVVTRSRHHRELAEELGAVWTGSAEEKMPHALDSAVIFAPAGQLVPAALRAVKKGGTVALAGIHMSPVPEMEFSLLYEERTLRSVANSTRADVRELLKIAVEVPIRVEVEEFPFTALNEAMLKLKRSEIRGSGVVTI